MSTPASPASPLVEFKGVHKRFGPLVVLDGVDMLVQRGESVVIIGASGSGKSVMLKHIVGLLKPDAGEVWFDGERVDTLPERWLMPIRRRCGFLFQMGALFDSLTVGENISFPIVEHTHLPPDEVARTVAHRLSLVGLPGIENKLPGELSGGQRKRVALARAIALEPEIILYDEPTTGLDPIRADVINELIIKLQRELKTASITVTHDMNSAFKVANRIVMLHDGKIIINGTPGDIRRSTDPVVRRFVTGEADESELAALQ
jgi:phospholipid/cholesterol/gamma-HCH transport system ATP-binding protein